MENRCEISYYRNEEQFFIVSIINLEDKGSMSTSISSDNPEVTERSVGEKYVTFFRDVEGVQAMFQEEAYIYVIDTNLEMEVMEQFIETME
ncbi:MAG: DUF4367 domain-containing protein [Lachnospiraceae bacterium]|nr:DUF4367 domain-containing protein [Lachnospiraceae bacterium]